jgi:hypothetical protein
MHQNKVIALTGILVTTLVSLGVGLLFMGRGPILEITLILSFMAALFNLLAIPYFLVGMGTFKAELQRAYIILSIGIGLFGLAQVQLPLVSLFNWNFWIDSGGVAVPYLLGVIGIFWGARIFARLLSIKNFWTSPLFAIAVSVMLTILAFTLPHVKVMSDEFSYHLALDLSLLNSIFITLAAISAFQIRNKIGPVYTVSMNWLFAALAAFSFAGWHYSVVQLTLTTGNWYYDYSFVIIPFIVGALLLIASGNTLNSIGKTPNGSPAKKDTSKISILDIITYIASLASNPTDIDVILDDVRNITSRIDPGQPLSVEDTKRLQSVYIRIESYLIGNDPLRVFTHDELEATISKQFRLSQDDLDTMLR